MTATDELRRLLDERGVEHYDHEHGEPLRDLSEAGPDPATSWRMGSASVCAVPNNHGMFDLWIDNATPEQAIAATLGSCNCSDNCTNGERTNGTCHVESSIIDTYEYNRWEYELSCGHTIIWEDSEPPNYCPDCGRRIEQ